MKFTKKQARECYDSFHGSLRCLNGGTRDENIRNAPRCRELLVKDMARAAEILASPSKLLAADAWLMDALSVSLPRSMAAFERGHPVELATVIPFPAVA